MKYPLTYFASNGLGENICQTPAIRELSKDREVTVVCPENLWPYFKTLPFVSYVIPWGEVNFKEHGDSSFHCDVVHNHWTSGHYTKWIGYPEQVNLQGGGADYVTSYCTRILGREVVSKMQPQDFELAMPDVGNARGTGEVCIFQGSNEPLRRLSDEVITKLYMGLRAKGVDSSIFTTGKKSADDFFMTCRAVNRAKLVITPDSGPFHMAMGYKINTIVLPTREPHYTLHHPTYRKYVHPWYLPGPKCEKECRTYSEDNKPIAGYPTSMKCWGKPCAALDLNDKNIKALVAFATSILDLLHDGKAPLYHAQPDAKCVRGAGPAQALTLPE